MYSDPDLAFKLVNGFELQASGWGLEIKSLLSLITWSVIHIISLSQSHSQ